MCPRTLKSFPNEHTHFECEFLGSWESWTKEKKKKTKRKRKNILKREIETNDGRHWNFHRLLFGKKRKRNASFSTYFSVCFFFVELCARKTYSSFVLMEIIDFEHCLCYLFSFYAYKSMIINFFTSALFFPPNSSSFNIHIEKHFSARNRKQFVYDFLE